MKSAFLLSKLALSLNVYADVNTDLKEVLTANFDALMKYDVVGYHATTTKNAIIIDEFTPFIWPGSESAEHYVNDFKALMAKLKVTNVHVTIKDLIFIERSGNSCYAVFPIILTESDAQGKPQSEEGLQTVTVIKTSAEKWRISSTSWSTIKSTAAIASSIH